MENNDSNDAATIATLPILKLQWDADKQDVGIEFDATHFKTWEFVLGVLEMAKEKAKFPQNAGRMVAMQQAQQEAAIRHSLADPKGNYGQRRGFG